MDSVSGMRCSVVVLGLVFVIIWKCSGISIDVVISWKK